MLSFVSDNPLAQNFPLTDGEVSFDVPTSITPGCNYIIARECLPFLPILHYDDVHRPPQSSATLGISAQNFVLKTRVHIEKKKLL